MERCLACEADAVGTMEGSRLLDNVSKIRWLFARSAHVTRNLQKRFPSRGSDRGRHRNQSRLTSDFSRPSSLHCASQRL